MMPEMTGNKKDVECVKYMEKPLKLRTADELDALSSNQDASIILFHSPHCKWCRRLYPAFNTFAAEMHRTNALPGSVPVVVAEINAKAVREDIDRMRPGFIRTFPTILYKKPKVDFPSGKQTIEGLVHPPGASRSLAGLAAQAAKFFGDSSLIPIDVSGPLKKLMNGGTNNGAEFIFLYEPNQVVIPRFLKPLDRLVVDKGRASSDLSHHFLAIDPLLASRGLAVEAGPDLRVPSIIDLSGGPKEHGHFSSQGLPTAEYSFGRAHGWALDHFS